MGVKMGWIQIKMGHPLAQNGAAFAPFRANGAHPSYPICACSGAKQSVGCTFISISVLEKSNT